MQSRRSILKTGLFLAGGYMVVKHGLPLVSDLTSGGFRFEPLRGMEGFRRFEGGQISQGFNPLIGLDAGDAAPAQPPMKIVRADLCAALFGQARFIEGAVPVASFSDYNCPYCRVLTQRLADLETKGSIAVEWHELPLLGPGSEFAARAALAAKRQGAYVALHERFMHSPVRPTPAYLQKSAEVLGLDAKQLLDDMNGPDVATDLRRSAALADMFGVIGTPALVVGRTLVTGAIDDRKLRRLVARERAEGPVPLPGCS